MMAGGVKRQEEVMRSCDGKRNRCEKVKEKGGAERCIKGVKRLKWRELEAERGDKG